MLQTHSACSGGGGCGGGFTTQHVGLGPSTVGCGTHAGEVQGVAQHGVHPAEDVRVAAGGEGRRLQLGVLQPAGVVSLRKGIEGGGGSAGREKQNKTGEYRRLKCWSFFRAIKKRSSFIMK